MMTWESSDEGWASIGTHPCGKQGLHRPLETGSVLRRQPISRKIVIQAERGSLESTRKGRKGIG